MISGPEFFLNTSSLTNREHSKSIDKLLGFRILKIERKLIQQYKAFYVEENNSTKKIFNSNDSSAETWIGLNPQVLLTPYSELYDIFNLISDKKVEKIIDIGCAYGRVGIVAKSFFPNVEFIGYEIVKKRINEANRISDNLKYDFKILDQNVLDEGFILPESSVYFIYDFSHFMHINVILTQMLELSKRKGFILVAKGDEVRSNIQLYFPRFYMNAKPIYKKDWSIFFVGDLF